jgi:hypothetical protein
MLTSAPTQRRRRVLRLGFFARRDSWTWSLGFAPTTNTLSSPRPAWTEFAKGSGARNVNLLFGNAHGPSSHDPDVHDSDEERMASSYTYTTRWFLSLPVIRQCQYFLLFFAIPGSGKESRPATFSVLFLFSAKTFSDIPLFESNVHFFLLRRDGDWDGMKG